MLLYMYVLPYFCVLKKSKDFFACKYVGQFYKTVINLPVDKLRVIFLKQKTLLSTFIFIFIFLNSVNFTKTVLTNLSNKFSIICYFFFFFQIKAHHSTIMYAKYGWKHIVRNSMYVWLFVWVVFVCWWWCWW